MAIKVAIAGAKFFVRTHVEERYAVAIKLFPAVLFVGVFCLAWIMGMSGFNELGAIEALYPAGLLAFIVSMIGSCGFLAIAGNPHWARRSYFAEKKSHEDALVVSWKAYALLAVALNLAHLVYLWPQVSPIFGEVLRLVF